MMQCQEHSPLLLILSYSTLLRLLLHHRQYDRQDEAAHKIGHLCSRPMNLRDNRIKFISQNSQLSRDVIIDGVAKKKYYQT